MAVSRWQQRSEGLNYYYPKVSCILPYLSGLTRDSIDSSVITDKIEKTSDKTTLFLHYQYSSTHSFWLTELEFDNQDQVKSLKQKILPELAVKSGYPEFLVKARKQLVDALYNDNVFAQILIAAANAKQMAIDLHCKLQEYVYDVYKALIELDLSVLDAVQYLPQEEIQDIYGRLSAVVKCTSPQLVLETVTEPVTSVANLTSPQPIFNPASYYNQIEKNATQPLSSYKQDLVRRRVAKGLQGVAGTILLVASVAALALTVVSTGPFALLGLALTGILLLAGMYNVNKSQVNPQVFPRVITREERIKEEQQTYTFLRTTVDKFENLREKVKNIFATGEEAKLPTLSMQ